jgi:hypothetical protein
LTLLPGRPKAAYLTGPAGYISEQGDKGWFFGGAAMQINEKLD